MNVNWNGNVPYSNAKKKSLGFPQSACLRAEISALLRYFTITDVKF